MESTTGKKSLKCVVVTPERAVLDEAAEFVALPMFDGELGVLAGRAPLIGRLGYGELRLVEGNHSKRLFVDGGFAQVRGDVVTVLTAHALRAEDINIEEVAHHLTVARQQVVTTASALDAQFQAQQRARAQLRIAHHESSAGQDPGSPPA